ncbi:MAG: DNA polymerase III subunit beta [Gammaproteobacteria bacterium PRO9]|nr:DNA polymerase III subunit beta [Gammaproteobacteria bacterium PRO9]
MQSFIESKRSEVEQMCRRLAVRRLELFGSAVRDDFDPVASDLDFLVEFDADSTVPALEQYFGLKEELEALFGRPVDLVMPRAVSNPYVRAEIERDRRLLYAA